MAIDNCTNRQHAMGIGVADVSYCTFVCVNTYVCICKYVCLYM